MTTYNENIWNMDDFNLASIAILNQPEDEFFNHIKEYHIEENHRKLESTYIDYFNLNSHDDDKSNDSSSEDEY